MRSFRIAVLCSAIVILAAGCGISGGLSFEASPPPPPAKISVVSIDPVTGSTGIPFRTSVSILFDKDASPTTINEQNIVITCETYSDVATGTYKYEIKTRTATFAPNPAFHQGCAYTVLVQNVKGMNGEIMEGSYNFTFETPPIVPRDSIVVEGSNTVINSAISTPNGIVALETDTDDILRTSLVIVSRYDDRTGALRTQWRKDDEYSQGIQIMYFNQSIYVAGNSNGRIWIARLDRVTLNEEAYYESDVILDAYLVQSNMTGDGSGNIYTIGYNLSHDIYTGFVRRYDKDLNYLDGVENAGDEIGEVLTYNSITLDADGNIYVSGYQAAGRVDDIFYRSAILKYDQYFSRLAFYTTTSVSGKAFHIYAIKAMGDYILAAGTKVEGSKYYTKQLPATQRVKIATMRLKDEQIFTASKQSFITPGSGYEDYNKIVDIAINSSNQDEYYVIGSTATDDSGHAQLYSAKNIDFQISNAMLYREPGAQDTEGLSITVSSENTVVMASSSKTAAGDTISRVIETDLNLDRGDDN